ncbi:DUF917 family protein [Rhodococcus sp. 3Y1]
MDTTNGGPRRPRQGRSLVGHRRRGDPFVGKMLVTQALGEAGEITILDPEELDDDAWVIPVAQMGAPTVVVEKMPRGTEPELALITLEKHTGRTADATMPMECGGINSMIPLLAAARRGLPVVDADGMGRAFPQLEMETFSVYGFRRVRSPWRTSTTRWRSSTPEVTTADWRASPAG